MKFTCAKNELKDALQVVNRAVAVKPQTPILAGVYLRAEGSTLEMQANNFSLGIITKIPVNTELAGEIVVVGKYLQEIVAKLPGETVTVTYLENEAIVKIQSGASIYELLAMKGEDFPKVKSHEVVTSFKIRSAVLKKMIRRTVFSCAADDATRPVFTGCLFELNGNNITVAATNTHRIAIQKSTVADEVESMNFIVPAVTLRDLVRMLDSSPDNIVTVDYSGKYVAFTFDNIFMSSRLIEGQFPPYEKVVPESCDMHVKIKVAEMLAAVERVGLISKETEYNTIRFVFTQEGLNISSNSTEVGKAEEHVNATLEGDDIDISFNVKYISEVLNVIESETCRIGLNKPLYPIDIREDDNDDYIYVVTPVRTNN